MSWDTKLSETITLKGGRSRFLTLRDAAEFLTERYSNARGEMLASTLADIMKASETPTSTDVQRATAQFARFLAAQGLVAPRPSTYHEDLPRRIAEMLAGRSRSRKVASPRSRGSIDKTKI